MWKLINIKACNINTFQKLDYDIHQNIATVVFGENKDNIGQERNGSGKSSLLEAISFAITGEPLRDVKTAEEIINDLYDEAQVCLSLETENKEHTFVIERILGRKSAQIIHTYYDGEEVVQPTVLDYNKYILSVIGLTKDDLYGNFILCRNRYKSFFKASDKEKKEIINRFSNGQMVDDAIAYLDDDIAVKKIAKESADKTVASYQGAVNAIQSEITDYKEQSDQRKTNKKNQIENLREHIANYRKQIRSNNECIHDCDVRKKDIDGLLKDIKALEQNNDSLEECYEHIKAKFHALDIFQVKDYISLSKEINIKAEDANHKLSELKKELKKATESIKTLQLDYNDLQKNYERLTASFENDTESNKKKADSIKEAQMKIESDLDKMDIELKQKEEKIETLKKQIAVIDVKLAGKIVCPKCHHEFLLGDKPIEDYQNDKEDCLELRDKLTVEINKKNEAYNKAVDSSEEYKKQLDQMRDSYRHKKQELDKFHDDVMAAYRKLKMANDAEYDIQNKIKNVTDDLECIKKKTINMRADLLDEAYNSIDDELLDIKKLYEQAKQAIVTYNNSIKVTEESIRSLEEVTDEDRLQSLNDKLKKYQHDLAVATKDADAKTEDYNVLVEQKTHFVEFKTYLANQKINAIAQITNEFLEEIGSDIRVQLDGYTVLKSGKVRDKISINLLRNGEDCGSFGKLSGGEQARVCLANILAMHRLTNMNCEDGKGLDILIIDEILDASDESGIASYCESLNNLQMTAIVVTQGYVAENYPYQLKVIKENGISCI